MVRKIEIFIGDLLRYVLHKNDIYSEGNLKLNESPPVSEGSDFTENVGKAVLVFSYVYRVMFKNRFYKSALAILRTRGAFDKYVEVFCSRSTEDSDYFTEFLVSLSFVTELSAYCYAVGCNSFCSLPVEAFLKVYEKHMESAFFSNGGWQKLHESATRLVKPYEILECIIQTESPVNDIMPILESAACLGLGEGFFTSQGVTAQEPSPESKKQKKKKRKKAAKAAEAKETTYSDDLVVTEADVILDSIMSSVILKREAGSFSTNIPGTSRTENWPECPEGDVICTTSEAKEVEEGSEEEDSEIELASGGVEGEESDGEELPKQAKAKEPSRKPTRGKTFVRQKRKNRKTKR